MNARIKTKQEEFLAFREEELARINKLWLFSINQVFGTEGEQLLTVYRELCEQSADAANRPELWYYIDETLIDKCKLGDIFRREDLDEREDALRKIKKENGRKWRMY